MDNPRTPRERCSPYVERAAALVRYHRSKLQRLRRSSHLGVGPDGEDLSQEAFEGLLSWRKVAVAELRAYFPENFVAPLEELNLECDAPALASSQAGWLCLVRECDNLMASIYRNLLDDPEATLLPLDILQRPMIFDDALPKQVVVGKVSYLLKPVAFARIVKFLHSHEAGRRSPGVHNRVIKDACKIGGAEISIDRLGRKKNAAGKNLRHGLFTGKVLIGIPGKSKKEGTSWVLSQKARLIYDK